MSATTGTLPIELPQLRKLTRYATNPLLATTEVKSRRKTTRAVSPGNLIAADTGEVIGNTMLYTTREVDDATFVKVFDAGIRAAFDLTGPAQKVFQLVLKIVASGRMQNDQIVLHITVATDPASPLKMSDKTFWRGMKELLAKRFIAAGTMPGLYWINPHLFFKGDRLLIVEEFVRQKDKAAIENRVALPGGG